MRTASAVLKCSEFSKDSLKSSVAQGAGGGAQVLPTYAVQLFLLVFLSEITRSDNKNKERNTDTIENKGKKIKQNKRMPNGICPLNKLF